MRRLALLAAALLLAAPAHAGWRNLLLDLPHLPPEGYAPGATVDVTFQFAEAATDNTLLPKLSKERL